MRVRVFISHSARDGKANEVRNAIRDRLTSEANRDRYAVLMDDYALAPGDGWRSRINLWLGACDAAVVLLSKDALASTYVAFELSVLGYRRWRAQRAEREFRIIPVLVDVEMKDVEASPLAPAQANEWMAVISGNAATVGDEVIAALDGVVAANARPIENLARVLDAHLPETDFYLEQAATALGVELPWDVAESARFCLALRLLGCGMSVEAVRAVRQLREDPTFQAKHMETIVDLLSCAWIDLKANEIPELVRQKQPPALALNAAFPDTAKMYMRSARYRGQPVLNYVLAEPNTIIEEKEDVREYRERIIEEVRKELFRKFEVDTEEDLDLALRDNEEAGEAVVVAICAPSIQPSTIAALRTAFEHVTFFLLTGARGNDSRIAREVFVIRPQLAPPDEEICRRQYEEFRRRIYRP